MLTDDTVEAGSGMHGSCDDVRCAALITLEGATLNTEQIVIEVANMRGFALRDGSILRLYKSRILTSFDRDELTETGASAILATDSDVSITESEITGAPPTYGVPMTPQIRLEWSTLVADRASFAFSEGGVVETYGSSAVTLRYSVLHDVASREAAVRSGNNGPSSLVVQNTVFQDLTADERGGQDAHTAAIDWWGDVDIRDSTFVDVTAKTAPWTIYARQGNVTLMRSTFCRAAAAVDPLKTSSDKASVAVAIELRPDADQSAVVVNNRFFDNQGALAVTVTFLHGEVRTEPAAIVAHNHFIGNRSTGGSALVADGYYTGAILFAHNVVEANYDLDRGDGDFPSKTPPSIVMRSAKQDELIVMRNVWFDNVPARDATALDAEAVTDDPQLGSLTGHCTPDDSGAFMAEGRPSYHGATRDRGTVAGLDPEQARDVVAADLDGSAPDLGAWGGPYAAPSEWKDPDIDGVPNLYDCDSSDDTVGSGLDDPPYDGIDQDCRSDDDYDADDDGFRPQLYAGEAIADCDDTDARRAPDHEEIPGNGVDDDCDGVADEWLPLDARGCSTAPAGTWTAALGLIAMLARRRRDQSQWPGPMSPLL
jgi:hypothetical protein